MKHAASGCSSRLNMPPADPRQRLRMRRFLMALGAYLFSSLLFLFYVLAGAMSASGYIQVSLFALTINLALLLLFSSGRNQRFSDPSLTMYQIIGGILTLTLASYHVDAGRGGLLLLYVVIFVFGVFRLHTRQFLALTALALVSHGAVLLIVMFRRPEALELEQELLQLMALVLLLPLFSWLGSNVSGLRARLAETNRELERAMEQINALAIRDDLTQLFNRRHMLFLLEQERERSVRTGSPFCLLMLDIDRFKSINDDFGHLAGDRILMTFSHAIADELRGIDQLARYGGEEFLVLLPDTELIEARRVAERLRRRVEKQCRRPGHAAEPLTVSVGVAEYLAPESVWKTLDRADRGLYCAKNAGRNCVSEVVDVQ
ncbi:MAG: GGDEF domain-containing protein [Ectothiorhodospiraceae bacterium]|nr:GGDEF domain-containing protein [Ectothiorhodospiraceae bacterium]